MAGFLIVHGLGNRRPAAHWQSWLADELRKAGRNVRYPQLPQPDAPRLNRWLEDLAREYRGLGDGERVVICHSLGCALWHAAWERGGLERPADRVLLVAPPGPSVLEEPASAEFGHLDSAGALRASCRVPVRLVASDRDPYCSEAPAADLYGGALGLDAETIAGAGHLTPESGYGPWPRVLDWCLDGRVRLSQAAAPLPGAGRLRPVSRPRG